MQVKNGDTAIPVRVSENPVPPLATSYVLPVGDALRADIAALQQQALTVQATIRALKQRETELSSSYLPEMPGMPEMPSPDLNYSADTLLLLPALALAALLAWIRTRRSAPVTAGAPASAPVPFDEKRAAPRPKNDPHWVDRDLDFVASDHHSDWGQDALSEQHDDAGENSRFWDPEAQAKLAAFDSETAAVEVHKVRESLAHKRAARAMGHGSNYAPLSDDEDYPPEQFDRDDVTADYARLRPAKPPLVNPTSVDLELDIDLFSAEPQPLLGGAKGEPRVEEDPYFGGDLDVELGLQNAIPSAAKPSVAPEPEPEPNLEPEPEETDTEPPSFSYPDDEPPLTPDEIEPELRPEREPLLDSNGETPCEIKLALAQEFLALGLLPGARDIATELLDSPQEDVREQAHALLAEIQVQEGADPMPLFESSAFVDPRSLMLSTTGQLSSSDSADSE